MGAFNFRPVHLHSIWLLASRRIQMKLPCVFDCNQSCRICTCRVTIIQVCRVMELIYWHLIGLEIYNAHPSR